MGSDLDYFNAFYRNNDPRAFTSGLSFDNVPGQPGYQAPSKYFQEPSLIDKGIGSIKDFFSNLGTSNKVRGTLGDRLSNQPKLPLPAAMASWSMSPFNTESRNYNPNFVDQLNFLETQDGMIGRDQGSGLLKYGPESILAGKNVISLFGSNNYQEALDKEVERLEGILEKNKNKWDATKIATWKAKFLEPAYLEQQTANQTFAKKQAEILAAKRAKAEADKRRQTDRRIISGGPNIQGDGGGNTFTLSLIHI